VKLNKVIKMKKKDISMWTLLTIAWVAYVAYRINQTEQISKAVINMTQPSSVGRSAAASSELFGSEIYNVY
jgi:hypothetical protein